jgi:putative heme transporter
VELRDRIRDFSIKGVVSTDLLVKTGRGFLSFVIAFFTIFFLIIYFLLDVERLERFLYFSTPRTAHRHLRALLPALQQVVGGYIRGQAITSAAIAVVSFVTLTVLNVPNALALAGIAAVADLIPLAGVFILITPMVLAAFQVSPLTAGIVLGVMLAYQQFEDRILVPKVYGSTLRLPTIAVVVAILVGAQLMGIVGALVALPIAAAIRVIVEYFATVKHASPAAAAADAVSE